MDWTSLSISMVEDSYGIHKSYSPPTLFWLGKMKVRRMEKTRNKTYKRIGDCLRISGFRTTDTYEDTLRKATCCFDDAAQADAGTLIISMGRVANCPLQNGKRWTLGDYLDELGGSRRITMGVYLPVSILVYMYLHIHH